MSEDAMTKWKLPFTPKPDPFAQLMGPDGLHVLPTDQMMTAIRGMGAMDHDKNFLENTLPRLDGGLKLASYSSLIIFFPLLLYVGSYLGFNTKFLLYILSNIAVTEAVSYVVHEHTESELSGSSIFGYTNMTMLFLLWWVKGYQSSYPLTFVMWYCVFEFFAQFTVPAASKLAHSAGIGVGMLWWKYGYGKRLPFG